MHIDIMVSLDNCCIPIELKYKTAKLSINIDNESYDLKNHGAQPVSRYDFLKDIERLELLSDILHPSYQEGYAIWLTNDESYLNPPSRDDNICEQFSVQNNSIKKGTLKWLPHAKEGTIINREEAIELDKEYEIKWHSYSTIDSKEKNKDFYYSIIKV